MWRQWNLVVLLFTMVLYDDVRAAWKYSRKPKKSTTVNYQNDAATYGPNVCAIQEVFRTGEKFYPYSVKKRLRKVCGNPTFLRYECCCGYEALDGHEGCPAIEPVKNIRETLGDLGLRQFTKLMMNTELEWKLRQGGAYTVFAPINEAFNKLTHDQKQRVFPWTYNALSLLHYHVVPGWHHSDHMKKTELLPSLYYAFKPVIVNRVSKKEMHTVNCARMVKSNILASNGVIHLIDQMLATYDLFGNITDVMFRDSAQFSQFIQVLYTSELFTMLREEGPLTVFAPSNYAFSRLPPLVLERVLREQSTAEAIIRHHTTSGIFCSSANIDKTSVQMLDGTRMKMQCKKNGQYLENSKIVKQDLLAGNGVIHIINKIQLPQFIQTLDGLARTLQLNKFLQLSYNAGLLDKLATDTEMTLFAPSDEAFSDLHKDKKRDLKADPTVFESIFDYSLTIGKLQTDSFVGDHGIIMNSGNLMKITIHRDGILMDDGSIISPNNECSNGVIHIVDKVLYPPEGDIFTIVKSVEHMSIFRKGLEYAELVDTLKDDDKMYTVFVPTDQAFDKLPTWQFDTIFDSKDTVKMLMQNHIVDRLVIHKSISTESILSLKSLHGQTLLFHRGKGDEYVVNTFSDVIGEPILASNGVIYEIDKVLDCDCESKKTEKKDAEVEEEVKKDAEVVEEEVKKDAEVEEVEEEKVKKEVNNQS